ncbi:MAG: hypothetical protein V1743_00165 [Nanoarchaeota archaeon]
MPELPGGIFDWFRAKVPNVSKQDLSYLQQNAQKDVRLLKELKDVQESIGKGLMSEIKLELFHYSNWFKFDKDTSSNVWGFSEVEYTFSKRVKEDGNKGRRKEEQNQPLSITVILNGKDRNNQEINVKAYKITIDLMKVGEEFLVEFFPPVNLKKSFTNVKDAKEFIFQIMHAVLHGKKVSL